MILFLLFIISISSTTSTEIHSDQLLRGTFDQSSETVSVIVGKRALLPCYVSLQDTTNNVIGSFKVIWMKLNGSSVLTMEDRAINGDSRISIVHAYADEWNLQINDIDEDDAGVYRCFTNNGMFKTVKLEVKVPPKIIDELTTEPYPPPIPIGSNFTIKCYAHGKPTPNIRILSYDQFDNAKMISEQNQVTIHNISRETNRRYECIASNSYPPDVARSFQLTIQYAPELLLFVNDEVISELLFINSNQNEIRLRCQVTMNPMGKIVWLKDNQPFHSHHQNYHAKNTLISNFIIKYFTDDYQGEYTCLASNSLGSQSKSIQLLSLASATTQRSPSKRKRPMHTRAPTDSLRIMTLSSKGVRNTYYSVVMFLLLFTVVYLK